MPETVREELIELSDAELEVVSGGHISVVGGSGGNGGSGGSFNFGFSDFSANGGSGGSGGGFSFGFSDFSGNGGAGGSVINFMPIIELNVVVFSRDLKFISHLLAL